MKMKKDDIIRGLTSIRHGKSASADQVASSSPATTTTTALSSSPITTTTITHHAGSKVLPIIETNVKSSSARSSPKEGNHGDSSDPITRKAKALSRMKDLMRWAAAAKAQKGGKFLGRKVMYFRNKGHLKGLNSVDGGFTSESPKISFRWDVESCSTTSTAISASSMPPLTTNVGRSERFETDPRKGNWITTDDEFVVLEL